MSDELDRIVYWEDDTDELVAMLGEKTAENEKLRADNQELREALEWVEWGCYRVSFLGDRMVHTCPFCGCIDENGHNSDCKLGNALKKARGE